MLSADYFRIPDEAIRDLSSVLTIVGGRVVPWRYGLDPQSVLLANDGTGRFTDVTEQAGLASESTGTNLKFE